MYVCICHGVTENELNAEIALGARSFGEVGERCAAGTGCGSCLDRIDDLLAAAARRREVGCCGTGCGAFCTADLVASRRDQSGSAERRGGSP